MKPARTLMVILATAVAVSPVLAKETKKSSQEPEKKPELMSAETFAGLELRALGPAVTSGRITDIAVDPTDPSSYYVASASGGVWRTSNGGATYKPVFDAEGSYSIGCVTLDPSNPNIVWVGTGENNSQRSVSWGDGVYVSRDGGTSWTNAGLKRSEHIGTIVVDPRDSNVVYVAAQGPLWGPGGDRGVYKTSDGGKTWNAVLTISENTGANEVVMDPRDPDTLYASSYQRRRRVWTLIDGGPESTIYKTTDAGKTWRKVDKGLPKVDMGRIGLAVSPADPDVVYAVIEAADDKGGFYRSTDRGESWEKRGDYTSPSAQYYNEIIADPKNVDRIYAMDTWMQVSEDGGKSFHRAGETDKHVDNHALWIDPEDTDHLLAGCDGGLYESFDRASTWLFKPNLPVTQFYKLYVDDAKPFYNVYGGTQDNFSLAGPSRNRSSNGIVNSDWIVTQGGDGFQTVVDPQDPNIVYAEAQYGELTRYDKASGQNTGIKPMEGKDEAPFRWNWDAPLIISPHSHTRLYFAANKVFRSDDRGDSWVEASGDLTRQMDRNTLPVMGRIWGPDAVAKSASTSFYGNITALSESPLEEGLLYAGTDDGLVQVTEDGGTSWRKIESFPGVPELAYVHDVVASVRSADTVYAAFDNHKSADFKPYLLRSTDRGRTWASISGDLPDDRPVYVVAEDPDSSLLFCGTDKGAYFSVDGGGHWIQLTGGMPATIAVKDLAVQRREGDLVLGTFGRGFYVLDDITPLRRASKQLLEQDAVTFPVKPALRYIEYAPLGLKGKSFQGSSFFTASNPPFGATVTYYLKDSLKTLKEQRQEREKETIKKGGQIAYPSKDELRAEAEEEKPQVLLTITDAAGNVVRRIEGSITKGLHRANWDLRYPAPDPPTLKAKGPYNPFAGEEQGPLVTPGPYRVTVSRAVRGETSTLGEPQEIAVVPLEVATLPDPDQAALLAFQRKTSDLQRAVLGAVKVVDDAQTRLKLIDKALLATPAPNAPLVAQVRDLRSRLDAIKRKLEGDRVAAQHNEPTAPSISDRVGRIVGESWSSTSKPTRTQLDGYRIAGEAFTPVLEDLRRLVEVDLASLDAAMERIGSPWTPGRVPTWKPE